MPSNRQIGEGPCMTGYDLSPVPPPKDGTLKPEHSPGELAGRLEPGPDVEAIKGDAGFFKHTPHEGHLPVVSGCDLWKLATCHPKGKGQKHAPAHTSIDSQKNGHTWPDLAASVALGYIMGYNNDGFAIGHWHKKSQKVNLSYNCEFKFLKCLCFCHLQFFLDQ